MSNPLTYAVARMTDTVRTWLGTWPLSEFPRVFGSGTTTTGIAVDEYSILNYSPVYACTAVISGDVGSLPLVLHKVSKDGSKERWEENKLYDLVHDRPNPEMSSMVLRETLQAHALTWGNGYAEIERDGANRPIALWPITPNRVTVFRDGRRLRYRVTNANGGHAELDQMNMLHIPGMGFDGTVGYSIVSLARESMSLGIATERFGGTFFGNGSTFGGVMSFPGKLTKEVKQGIRESIDGVHTGVDRAHKFVIFGDGAKFDKLGIPPNDAQFLETRRFQIAEVARWFGGIPLHKIGDLEHATFSNIEQQDIEYYKSCLRRWIVRWEQELNYKLISPLERRYQRIEFNVEGLLRGDSAARATFYSQMFNVGVFSINEIRKLENMNQIGAEGDVHYVPVNLQPAELAMKPPPLPIVTDITPPKELPPAEEDEEDETDDRAILMLTEIAEKTAAIETGLAAQRDAISRAELETWQGRVTRLEEERAELQRVFEADRVAHDVETDRLEHARQDIESAASEARAAAAVALSDVQAGYDSEASARVQAVQHQAAADEARTAAEAAAAIAALQAAEAMRAKEQADGVAAEARAVADHTAALLADAEQKRHAADEARMAAEAAAAVSSADASEAHRAKQQADVMAAEALAAADIASTRLADAEQKRQSAEVAEREAATALQAQREAEVERLTGMLAAHRALIVDAMGRMVRRETQKARYHQATPEKLRRWMESFYVTEEDFWVEALTPTLRVHLAWQRSEDDPNTVTRAIVSAHFTESLRQLRAVVDGEPDELSITLDRMLQKWEQVRPSALADQVLRDEVQYVRHA